MSNKFYVNDYINQYLVTRSFNAAPSTFISEKSKANRLKKYFKNSLVADVRHSDILVLKNWLEPKYANKTINEFLIILRAVFKMVVLDGVLALNPMEGIENSLVEPTKPNPFEKNELSKLFATHVDCEQGKNACELDVHTGLRIGELLALGWADIDLIKKELYVRHAKVLNQYKVPKTKGSIRTVELNDRAIEILKRQLKLTGTKRAKKVTVLKADNKKKEEKFIQFVFYNSKTKQPFKHAAEFNKDVFTPWLAEAGVKHRGVGQLRHTFASQCLTAGIPKEWIAKQMGHAGTNMIDLHYGMWIKADAPDCANTLHKHLSNTVSQSSKSVPSDNPIEPKTVESNTPTSSVNAAQFSPELLAAILLLQSRPDLVSLLHGFAKGPEVKPSAQSKSVHGTTTAMNGTESANVIPYLKNGMTEQPAALPSHFCYAKDERELRASEVSLDSLKKKAFASSGRVVS